jgi:Lanthionine synthetase C-like protein
MQGIYDPARHEPLTATRWSEDAARAGITRIAQAAEDAFDATRGSWPMHPRDDPTTPEQRYHGLYLGAAGVIWALRDLASVGAIRMQRDYQASIESAAARTRQDLADSQHGTASFLFGESGALLLQWQATRRTEVADALFALVQGNIDNPVNEALWGNAGTVLAAIHMSEASGEVRWMSLVQRCVKALLDTMMVDPKTGCWISEQDMYGRRSRYLGAGHGFVGNVYPALRGAGCLDALTVATFEVRVLQTLAATALHGQHDGVQGVNWHPFSDSERVAGRLPMVQDCHGAAGIVCRLAAVPRSEPWDALLRAAGELTWFAGPLSKGPSLCHGTAGSAMACLKLWRRFSDAKWLDRGRRLAMHALEQVEAARTHHGQGRHTLWTGDLGVAIVLWNAIQGDDRFPTLDYF